MILTGARPYLVSPILEEIGQGLLERDRAAPADGPLGLLRRAAEDRHVGGPEPRRVLADLDAGSRGLPDEETQHALDGPVHAGAEVVDLARRPALEQEPVAAHDVAHVREVAGGLEVADEHDRLPQPRLDLGDLLGEVRGGEGLAPTGAGVVERAGPHDVHAVALEVLPAHEVLRDLAHRVRRERPQRVRLPDRQLVGVDEPVLLARADDQEARGPPELAHRLEEVHLADDVRVEGLDRGLPGGRDEALSGEVDDPVRARLAEERPDREDVAQVDGHTWDLRALAALCRAFTADRPRVQTAAANQQRRNA